MELLEWKNESKKEASYDDFVEALIEALFVESEKSGIPREILKRPISAEYLDGIFPHLKCV
jgi:hypothetical protein